MRLSGGSHAARLSQESERGRGSLSSSSPPHTAALQVRLFALMFSLLECYKEHLLNIVLQLLSCTIYFFFFFNLLLPFKNMKDHNTNILNGTQSIEKWLQKLTLDSCVCISY